MELGQGGDRSASFQKLKPSCIALSKITISAQSKTSPELQRALEAVLRGLQEVGLLDAELANYVFFPLARVFGKTTTVSAKSLEISLKCLRILISKGWSQSRDTSLCRQLLILLSFIADPSAIPGNEEVKQTDIVILASLDCLWVLFAESSTLLQSLSRNEEDRPIPVLGQTVSALLTTLRNDLGPEIDIHVSRAIKAFVSCLREETLLLNFLPGIVSALTKYAASRGNARKPAKSLVDILESLEILLCGAFAEATPQEETKEKVETSPQSAKQWREAQATQVTKALSQIIHLRYHENEDVRSALFSLCAALLRDCQPALQESVSFLLSTAISLCGPHIRSPSRLYSSLCAIIASNATLLKNLDRLMQEWITALPRLALDGDRDKLQKQSDMLVAGYRCASQCNSSSHLCGMVLRSVQESVTVALPSTSPGPEPLEEDTNPTSKAMTMTMLRESVPEFKPFGHTVKGTSETLQILQATLLALTEDHTFRDYAYQALAISASSQDEELLSSLWLAKEFFWRRYSDDANTSQFLVGFDDDQALRLDEIEAIYSQAVNLLTSFDENVRTDWRIQAMSLEIIAKVALEQGMTFQSELVDVLFPVIERIGSSHIEVRERALSCLNTLATSCGANSAGDLIIQNADYLVNSMALKLNAFELSAQAPRVMVMVIHLCGPSLIPYLDDILESIFSALSSFHGYPSLVDALFSVLEAIVDQGSSPSSNLLDAPVQQHMASRFAPTTIPDVIDEVKHLKEISGHVTKNEPAQASVRDKTDDESEHMQADSQEQKVEPSKTYQMVQSIARHSQYYLTHSSPGLRQRLLKLIGTASKSLSRNEDQYLPLINDIWPVIVARLYDLEATVSLEAMESLTILFKSAGDFLLSRIQTEWPRIVGLGKRIRAKTDAEHHGKSGRGSFSMNYQLLERYIAMLLRLVVNIGISGPMEDDIFELFSDLHSKASVSHLLEEVNADAYWLLDVRSNKGEKSLSAKKPVADGFHFADCSFYRALDIDQMV